MWDIISGQIIDLTILYQIYNIVPLRSNLLASFIFPHDTKYNLCRKGSVLGAVQTSIDTALRIEVQKITGPY